MDNDEAIKTDVEPTADPASGTGIDLSPYGSILEMSSTDAESLAVERVLAKAASSFPSTSAGLGELRARAGKAIVKTRELFELANDNKLGWRRPLMLTPAQGALLALGTFVIRDVRTPEQLGSETSHGVLAMYAPELGIFVELGPRRLDELATTVVGAPGGRWKDEFERTLRDKATPVCEENDANLVFMNNCILNYETKERIPFSAGHVSLYKYPTDLAASSPEEPSRQCPDGTFETLTDVLAAWVPYDGGPDLLYKLAGAVLRNNFNWRVMPTLYNATGHNGKSTCLTMLAALVGKDAAMFTTLQELCGGRFSLGTIVGKRIIVIDDSDPGTYVKSTARLKTVIAHGTVSVERKGKDVFYYGPNLMVICAANELPKSKDKTNAWTDRQLFVPFTGQFVGCDDDKHLVEWLTSAEVLEYLAYRSLVEMENYFELPEPGASIDLKQTFITSNDSVVEFWEEFGDKDELTFLPFEYLWQWYLSWMDNSHPATSKPSRQSFSRRISEVACANGTWVMPLGNDGKGLKFSTSSLGEDRLLVPTAKKGRYDSGYTYICDRQRGLVLSDVHEWCLRNKTTPRGYMASRKSKGDDIDLAGFIKLCSEELESVRHEDD